MSYEEFEERVKTALEYIRTNYYSFHGNRSSYILDTIRQCEIDGIVIRAGASRLVLGRDTASVSGICILPDRSRDFDITVGERH